MKSLIAKCEKCGFEKVFRGKSVYEILINLDDSGWLDDSGCRDFPVRSGEISFVCPKCKALEMGK